MGNNKAEFDRFAESYEEQLNCALLPGTGDGSKFARIKASHLSRQLEQAFGSESGLRLLDAGCGIGVMDELLKPAFPKISGFDISSESIRQASLRNPELSYRISDGASFPYPDEEFDAVFAVCVLHHIHPDQRAGFCREAARVVRPGGFIFLYEHNPLNPLTRWVVNRCVFDRGVALLFPGECRRHLQQAGFEVVGGGGLIFFPLESPAWQRWEARWLFRIPLGAQYFFAGRKEGGSEKSDKS